MKKNLLLSKIKVEFPDMKWKKATHVTCGWDHEVIILDGQWIFRFPKEGKTYGQDFKYEPILLRFLEKNITLPVPHYVFLAKNLGFGGYQKIPGTPLKFSTFKKMKSIQRKQIGEKLGQFLSELHAIPLHYIKKFHIKTVDTNREFDEFSRDIKHYVFPRFSETEKNITQGYLDSLQQTLKHPYKNTLVHHDLHWEHILVDHIGQLTGIIDFSDRRMGDPAVDFSGFWRFGKKFVELVYKYYRGRKDVYFLERSRLLGMRYPLWDMIDSFKHGHTTFKKGYRNFKRIFI